ncbi:MAG: 3-hydroxyacyl-CoA dehydrogenase NAD-binding domain-containing protein [Ignavibacteria bacterium]|nr:3-hydroxyacyl-CoA dehydrogenase NAD-binding domain-containing protein [Ignavibacteria bacterium]
MSQVAVIGGGTMGNGIALVSALYGFRTTIVEQNEQSGERALVNIENSLERMVKKGTVSSEQMQQILDGLVVVYNPLFLDPDTDIAIEAIYENKAAKLDIYSALHKCLKPEAIIATNTSAISITELAVHTRPEKFIGMHFMNPVPVMKLVEIIRGYSTSDDTFSIVHDLALKMEKTPVEVQDYPGFISNRILMPMINEAVFALMEGVANKEAIDTVMKLGMNHPMGPLALADFIGLDVCLAIMNVLYEGYKDSKYRPCPLLVKMVSANKLGRKTGEGFYQY